MKWHGDAQEKIWLLINWHEKLFRYADTAQRLETLKWLKDVATYLSFQKKANEWALRYRKFPKHFQEN